MSEESEELTPVQQELLYTIDSAYKFNPVSLTIYTRLWQLETWLRQLVYVELSAKYGSQWHAKLPNFRPSHLQHDKHLRHMPTAEELPLSFVTFGSLVQAISQEWSLFETFIHLPQNIWEARIEEVSQIRNRVAHFRNNHQDDLQRLLQLLRDIDEGFWEFCVSMNSAPSYNAPSNDPLDPVMREFGALISYSPMISTSHQISREFFHLVRSIDVSIKALKRPWTTHTPQSGIAGLEGWIYDVEIYIQNDRYLRYTDLLRHIRSISTHIIYAVFSTSSNHLRVFVPAILGERTCKDVISSVLRGVSETITSYRVHNEEQVLKLVENAPEYILDDVHGIAMLSSDMPACIFCA